jgi:hypothetical protein
MLAVRVDNGSNGSDINPNWRLECRTEHTGGGEKKNTKVFIFCYNLLAFHSFIRKFTFVIGDFVLFVVLYSLDHKFNARDKFPLHSGSIGGRLHCISMDT